MVFPDHKKQGSTLLMTILTVSLLLIIVLTYTVQVRMELRAATNRINLLRAKQNAKLAMHLALNKLQLAAGPDQRITARAGLLAIGNSGNDQFTGTATEPNRFWTGVWEQDGSGNPLPSPTWLVSGSSPSPFSAVGAQGVEIYPEVNSHPAIRVDTDEIEDGNGNIVGESAYWISDEGVKASLTARRGFLLDALNGNTTIDRTLTEYQANFGVDLNMFFENPYVDLNDRDFAESLLKLLNIDAVSFVKDSSGQPFDPRGTEVDSHQSTLVSYGVLENPLLGGLKTNLSDPDFRDTFLATDETARFLAPKEEGALFVEDRLPSDKGVSEGEPYFSPRPLLTEAVLYIGLFHTFSDAKLRIRYHVQSEFLNPYSLPLEFPRDGSSSRDRAMVMVFDNLPTITVTDQSGVAPTITENLNDFSAYSNSDSRKYINTWKEISADQVPDTPTLLPGEVYRVMEPNPNNQPRGLARDFGTVRWSENQTTRPEDTAQIRIQASHSNLPLTLKLVPYRRVRSGSFPDNPIDREPIQQIELRRSEIEFNNFNIQKTFNSGPNPFSRPSSGGYVREDYNFAYHFRLLSDETDPTSMRDYLSVVSYLDPDFDTTTSFTDLNGQTHTKERILDPISLDPPSVVQDDLNLFSDLDVIRDLHERDHQESFRRIVLIDVPDGDALSIGQLSSLPIYRRPPRLIGSERGGTYNQAFDRYYFSPKEAIGSSFRLANPALTHINSPDDPSDNVVADVDAEDAAHEFVNGAFNINSTSVEAWKSLLAAPVLTPPSTNRSGEGPLDVSRAGVFFRHPQYSVREDDFVVRDATNGTTEVDHREKLRDPERAFSQGMRAFDDGEGTAFLQYLAEEIVSRLQQRGKPFVTMESFVNSGILQDAIDAYVGNEDLGINEGIFDFSNLYFLQNDIMTKIAPVAQTRSDTFRIRAYGSYVNPVTGEKVSEARCEVLVQRTPKKLNGSDPMSPADGFANMRRFEIVSFRWIHDEDT